MGGRFATHAQSATVEWHCRRPLGAAADVNRVAVIVGATLSRAVAAAERQNVGRPELSARSTFRLRMQNDGVEFTFETEVVGLFTDKVPPANAGVYRYKPLRGPGHLHMQEQLTRSPAICAYVVGDTITSFKVFACPAYGMLKLAMFETNIQKSDLSQMTTSRGPHHRSRSETLVSVGLLAFAIGFLALTAGVLQRYEGVLSWGGRSGPKRTLPRASNPRRFDQVTYGLIGTGLLLSVGGLSLAYRAGDGASDP